MEYSVNLRAEQVNFKIYRIFFVDIDRQLLPYLEFKFEYKCNDEALWQTVRSFECRSCRVWKENGNIFTYIRVPNKLNDYLLNIRLSLRIFANAFGFESNKWMKYGDILTIKVLSTLYSSTPFIFNIGSFVKFRPPNHNKFHYGQIEHISSDLSTNKNNKYLNVCTIKDFEEENKIWNNIPIKLLLQLLSNDYIDFCVMDRNYADFQFLFRKNNTNRKYDEYFNIYCVLNEYGMIYESEYIDQYENEYCSEISINAKGRCFAYNVMVYLFEDNNNTMNIDYNLKINCLKDCGSFLFTKSINTVNKHKINNHLGIDCSFGCDICRSVVDQFDFMFHCDNINELQHDFCMLCVYEMIKKYEYFMNLLKPLLFNNKLLNNTCIDVLISFIVGKSIKFQCH